MKKEYITQNGRKAALIHSESVLINDAEEALDLAMSVSYESGADRIAMNKEAIGETFFMLSTGLAGEILQKFINYHVKLAVYGDFSQYTSKPLKDFIYEANQGRDFFFVESAEQAMEKLLEA